MLEQECPKLNLPPFHGSELEALHRKLFTDVRLCFALRADRADARAARLQNGDALAQIYAGSGAMTGSVRLVPSSSHELDLPDLGSVPSGRSCAQGELRAASHPRTP